MAGVKITDIIDSSLISSKMKTAMALWEKMYKDMPPWAKDGTLEDPTEILTLGLPALIASEKARMAVLEMKSTITGATKAEQESEYISFLNDTYQEKVVSKLRYKLEPAIALGGFIMKPYVVLDGEGSGTIEVDFILQNNFKPIAFNANGDVSDAAFLQTKVTVDKVYTRVERHTLKKTGVTITNTAFVKNIIGNAETTDINYLGEQIPLEEVPEWADFEEETEFNGVKKLLFAYFKMPDANTIDLFSPLGVSGFSKAVKLIKQADMQYSRLIWEFKGGELAIDVDRNALIDNSYKDDDGNIHNRTSLGIMQQRLFRKTGIDTSIGETYKVFSPTLRDSSIINGLNTIKMQIEDVTALSRGTLSDANQTERTATELKINKQRTYQSNSEIQKELEKALKDLVYAMSVYADYYNLFTTTEEYAVSFTWDDSIINDVQEELNTRLILTQNGIESKINLRMWYFGETEEQARAALAKIAEEDEGIKIEEE